MNRPFEKFIVMSVDVNTFQIRVADPEYVRTSLESAARFAATSKEEVCSELMMRRYLFIDDAIREKLASHGADS